MNMFEWCDTLVTTICVGKHISFHSCIFIRQLINVRFNLFIDLNIFKTIGRELSNYCLFIEFSFDFTIFAFYSAFTLDSKIINIYIHVHNY